MTQRMIDAYFRGSFKSIEHVGPDRPKGEVCAEIDADILVDDNLHNLEGARQNGVPHLLMFGNYPWQVFQDIEVSGLVQCKDWERVREEVERIANQ